MAFTWLWGGLMLKLWRTHQVQDEASRPTGQTLAWHNHAYCVAFNFVCNYVFSANSQNEVSRNSSFLNILFRIRRELFPQYWSPEADFLTDRIARTPRVCFEIFSVLRVKR